MIAPFWVRKEVSFDMSIVNTCEGSAFGLNTFMSREKLHAISIAIPISATIRRRITEYLGEHKVIRGFLSKINLEN
jgi:hypothetical protein